MQKYHTEGSNMQHSTRLRQCLATAPKCELCQTNGIYNIYNNLWGCHGPLGPNKALTFDHESL